MTDRLAVLLYGQVVGHLERETDSALPVFRYTSEYSRTGDVALSAQLPLTDAPYPPQKVEPYLRGLLPENRATLSIWSSRLGTSPDDVHGILARMGWDCPGAVQFCPPAEVDTLLQRRTEYEPVSDTQIEQRLQQLLDRPASWSMPDEHWSLAGQQEKFALARIQGSWYEAHGSAATTHIIKPGIKILHHQALVEHATMAAAARLGVDVAGSELLRFGDQWAIVVERFDRVADAGGNIIRVHQEDFAQALGRLPERKYESRGGPGLADMVRLLRRQSTGLADELLALADFLVVNLVAGAPDGHAKNISMLYTSGRRWVAPLYDLATGLAYASETVDRSVAVSVGGERQPAKIYRKQWDKAAGTLGLGAEQLQHRVRSLATGFPAAFADVLEELKEAPGADEVAERAVPALQAHCDLVLDHL